MSKIYTMGLDIGSTYTKAVILGDDKEMVTHVMGPTGARLLEAARNVANEALKAADMEEKDISYIITTGYGRHIIPFRDFQVTDLTASAHGAVFLFPETRTILDIGGQTMKASLVDERTRIMNFRLNDRCAAGTGAFLEKTARYMGYNTMEIGSLLDLSKQSVDISGVCAVFAESEVISHLSEGVPPEDIMYGSILSLTARSVQLMRRIKARSEYTLTGGILRWKRMADVVKDQLKAEINVPDDDMAQFTAALGCAILAHRRLEQVREREAA